MRDIVMIITKRPNSQVLCFRGTGCTPSICVQIVPEAHELAKEHASCTLPGAITIQIHRLS